MLSKSALSVVYLLLIDKPFNSIIVRFHFAVQFILLLQLWLIFVLEAA
ncbi:hypothetical protein N483_14185 [Pseudoalteromonas luteoviolacea NCIMB 1944]|nr:hypothetical protein N483_14185 [Pseudoalteromonas luteoviolacea NCIMB 1944]